MNTPTPSKPAPWRIQFHDVEFTDDDITGGDLLAIQLYVDDGWNSTDVFASPLHLLVTTAVMYSRIADVPLDDVRAELGAMKFTELPLPQPRKIE